MNRYTQLAYTATVQQAQHEQGSHAAHHRRMRTTTGADALTDTETTFSTTRDGFYLATVGDTGWPYIQYRGDHPASSTSLTPHLAFTDVRGNRQYITTGNLRANNRVGLFHQLRPPDSTLCGAWPDQQGGGMDRRCWPAIRQGRARLGGDADLSGGRSAAIYRFAALWVADHARQRNSALGMSQPLPLTATPIRLCRSPG
jgi:hypothetical protein